MCVCQSTKRDMVRNRGKLKQARNGAGLSPTHSVVKWVDKGTRLLSSPWQQGLGGGGVSQDGTASSGLYTFHHLGRGLH